MLGVMQARKGIRVQGPVIVMTAIGAGNAVAIYTWSNYAAQIGTKTLRIKRIKGLNSAGVNTNVHIGTGVGAAYAGDIIPPLHTFDGLNFDFVEFDLPEVEVAATISAYPVALNVDATVTIQIECEELG